jgi:hypothetical protein
MRIGVALILVSACYSPQPSPGAPCPDGVCPTGLVCSPSTQTCERHAIDAGTTIDGPRLIDARIDGPPDAYVPPQPMLRQQAASYANSAASLSATFPASPTSGNLIVMIGGTPTAPLTSVTGGGIATWQLAASSTVQSNVEVWYGITDGSSATVTIALTNNSSPTWLTVSEWANVTGVVDASNKLDGTASPATAGMITTTTRDLLVFGVSQFAPTTIGSPTPGTWTALQPIDGFVKQREWYRVEPTAGTYGASVSVSSGGWDAALVAFKIAP